MTRAPLLLAVALVPVVLAACGTRVPRADVIAAAGGGPVTVATTGLAAVTAPPTAVAPTAAADTATAGGTTASTPSTSGGDVPGAGTRALPGGAPTDVQATTGATGASAPSSAGRSPAATSGSAAQRSGQPCATQGSPIVFGQVGTFSGIIGASQGSAAPGLKVWAAATNAAGGIACHPVQVVSVDDGGDAGKAQSAVQSLIQSDHAVAINAFVPVTLNGIQTAVDDAKVPVVGGDGLGAPWTSDPDLYPSGTSFEAVIYAFLKYGAMEGGHRISMFYCIEATPCTAAQQLVASKLAKAAGLVDVGDQPISLAGANFTQQCATAKSKGADVVFMGAGATAVSAIARDCSNQNYHPIYITESLAAINSLQSDPHLNGLIIGLADFPWMLATTPAEAAFQAALARYAPSLDAGGAAAQAWAGGELLKAAILKLGDAARGDITPGLVTQGLHMVKDENLQGLAPNGLTFTAGGPAWPDRCAFIASVANGKWTAPIGNQQICEP